MWNQSINLYRYSSDLQKKSSHDTFQIEQVWTVLIKTPYDVMMSGMKMFSVKSRIQLKDIWYELKFRLAVCSHLCSWCQNVSWYLLQMLFSLYWFYFLHFFGGRYFPLTSQLCQVLNENKLWDYLCSHVLRWRRNLLSWELISRIFRQAVRADVVTLSVWGLWATRGWIHLIRCCRTVVEFSGLIRWTTWWV